MRKFTLILIILLFGLAGCQNSNAETVDGRILLWHDWPEEELVVLDNILTKFGQIYPEVTIIRVAVPEDELLNRYRETAELGLGPDLLLGPNTWILPLANEGLIAPLPGALPEPSPYLSTAVEAVRYNGRLYGLPISLKPVALYYNTRVVTTPATTLEAWLNQAADGKQVALNTEFVAAFWGIHAFGGQLFDATGRAELDQGSFANWLNWLKQAQDAPGMILDRDPDTLRQLFIDERAAYYTAGPDELAQLQAAMGKEIVGVAPLPDGPNDSAGPLLQVDAIMFNSASSENQATIAFALAQFLTNAEQSTVLMRDIGRVPANQRVRVNPRIYPAIAGFSTQARTAVPWPNRPQMTTVLALGNDAYRRVLEGIVAPNEAAVNLVRGVNEQAGLPGGEAADDGCPQSALLQIGHSWRGDAAATLERIAQRYAEQCPQATIELLPFAEGALLERLQSDDGPLDLVIAPHIWLPALVTEERLLPLAELVQPDNLQRYTPAARAALQYANKTYGLPVAQDTVALYYNQALVGDPPATLENLRLQGQNQALTLPITFQSAAWGVGAFGGALFTVEEALLLNGESFVQWLNWLKIAQSEPEFSLTTDILAGRRTFTAGQSAYWIDTSEPLSDFQSALGEEQLQVAILPSGPGGTAAPPLLVQAFLFPAIIETDTLALALDFALFATNSENQMLLAVEGRRVPTNVNVTIDPASPLSIFAVESGQAVAWPTRPGITTLLLEGDRLFADVLLDDADPAAALQSLNLRLRQIQDAEGEN